MIEQFIMEVLLALLLVGAVVLWQVEAAAWRKERQQLLNRVMSRDWAAYVAMAQTEETPEEKKQREDTTLTTDYEKAWTN